MISHHALLSTHDLLDGATYEAIHACLMAATHAVQPLLHLSNGLVGASGAFRPLHVLLSSARALHVVPEALSISSKQLSKGVMEA